MSVRQRKKQKSKATESTTTEDSTTSINQNGNIFQKFCCYMFEPDDASYLAVFRIMWGLIMVDEIWNHCAHDFAKTMNSFYENSTFFAYKYYGLEWCVAPADPYLLKIFMVVMLVLAIFITIGFLYRISSILFAFGFVYMFGLEAALYLNHFYLVAVMSVMLCFLPCNVYFSVDALIFPNVASKTVPK